MRFTWIQPEDLVPHGLAIARQQGREVGDIARRWEAAGGATEPPAKGASPVAASPRLRELALSLLDELDRVRLPDDADDFAALSRDWPPGPRTPAGGSGEIVDRVHGAWLGRAAGCLLGKPVEGLPRQGIADILRSGGRWPLSGYFTERGLDPAVTQRWPWNRRSRANSLLENIDGMPEDDDLNYPLLALLLLEDKGVGFSSEDVALGWLDLLPAGRTFTAERIAYRNLLLGLTPPYTARVHNPFAEWIGAQIRTDLYGWTHPGDPAFAAELAYRDARVSHVRNGIYGAMYAAAMASVAVAGGTVEEVLDAGHSVVPQGSALNEAIAHAREVASRQADWERVVDALHQRYRHLHWVHVLNNAALTTAALVHGDGDFTASITSVVSGGWDTDSNGATVGGILGALTGAAELPAEWIDPLAGTLRTSIPGHDRIGFGTLAERTVRLHRDAGPKPTKG